MGAVYEAVHKRLRNQRFAIKVLHAKMVENEKIFARFQREAEIATAVGHPSIVYVLDFYETDDGRPCMVMEFLEGEDLGQRLDREERIMPREEVLRIIGTNREWTRKYPIKVNLVNNPKTPVGVAMSFLSSLLPKDLRNLSNNKNVSSVIAQAASVRLKARTER